MNLYEILNKLDINYEEIEHKPVYTIEQSNNIKNMISGVGCKNLFLTDKKNYYLVLLEDKKRADIKEISKIINTSHMSFATPDELKKILNLEPGSVTPFGIINDTENKVLILIDSELKNQKLLFHPNTNIKTISIYFSDLIRFIEYENHKYFYL